MQKVFDFKKTEIIQVIPFIIYLRNRSLEMSCVFSQGLRLVSCREEIESLAIMDANFLRLSLHFGL